MRCPGLTQRCSAIAYATLGTDAQRCSAIAYATLGTDLQQWIASCYGTLGTDGGYGASRSSLTLVLVQTRKMLTVAFAHSRKEQGVAGEATPKRQRRDGVKRRLATATLVLPTPPLYIHIIYMYVYNEIFMLLCRVRYCLEYGPTAWRGTDAAYRPTPRSGRPPSSSSLSTTPTWSVRSPL